MNVTGKANKADLGIALGIIFISNKGFDRFRRNSGDVIKTFIILLYE